MLERRHDNVSLIRFGGLAARLEQRRSGADPVVGGGSLLDHDGGISTRDEDWDGASYILLNIHWEKSCYVQC